MKKNARVLHIGTTEKRCRIDATMVVPTRTNTQVNSSLTITNVEAQVN